MEAMTAAEFLAGLGQETTVVTLSNKLRVELRRVDILAVMAKTEGTSVPMYGKDTEKKDVKVDPETLARAKDNFNQLVFATCVSPRFVAGDGVDKEKNEIGIDHPLLGSGVKAELIAAVLEFNGFSGIAAEFFRLTRRDELGTPGPRGKKVRATSPPSSSGQALGAGSRRLRGKKGNSGRGSRK